jgi:hypothetical protein
MAYANNAPVANTVNNYTEFENSWTLKNFAKMFVGKPKHSSCDYTKAGKHAVGLKFPNADGSYTFVAYAASLLADGMPSDEVLKAGRNGENNLCVGKNHSGFYYLFYGTSVVYKDGEEVDW